MNHLQLTWRMVAAEFLKMKRTLALTLALIAPMAPAGLSMLVGFATAKGVPPGVNPWNLVMGTAIEVWSIMMLPFMVALQAALMSNLEGATAQWKHLYALPVSRVRLYLVKSGVLASLLLLSSVVLLLSVLAAGAVLGAFKPQLGLLTTMPDWGHFLGGTFRPFVAATLLIAIHQWVGHRWPSIAVALGVGVMGLTGGLLLASSERFGSLYPWSLPLRVARESGGNVTLILVYAVTGCAVLLALGAWDARRREMV